jgi:hypothetical protein
MENKTMNTLRQMTKEPLSNDQLMRVAPSIFATQAWEKMSNRYAFIPTIQVVEELRKHGVMPFEAMQARAVTAGRREFVKHMVRFRDMRAGALRINALGGVTPELVLFNSHDGACIYKLVSGLIRDVCFNMSVLSDGNFASVAVRHSGRVSNIIDASFSVVEQFPKAIEAVERFASLRVTAPQQQAYAEAALMLKYEEGQAPVTPADMIAVARQEDADPTLWNTFNRVQEKLINGGVSGRNRTSGRRQRTRATTGITENTKLNQALWALTEKMGALLAG